MDNLEDLLDKEEYWLTLIEAIDELLEDIQPRHLRKGCDCSLKHNCRYVNAVKNRIWAIESLGLLYDKIDALSKSPNQTTIDI